MLLDIADRLKAAGRLELALAAGLLLAGCATSGSPPAPALPSPPSPPSASPPSPPSASPPSPPSASPPGAPAAPRATAPAAPQSGGGQAASATPATGEGEDGSAPGATAGDPAAAKTAEEHRAGVEREIDASLSEFDRLLLREREVLAQQRDGSTSAGGGAAGGGAAGGGAAGGGAAGGDGEGDAAESDNPSETSGNSPGAPVGAHRAPGSPAGEDPGAEEDSSRVPSDIPAGDNDDIVARQLREAAMNEDDPELREKLWDEYRRYKGIQKGGSE